jgi:hypothetical protein
MGLSFTLADVAVINVAEAALRANHGYADNADEGHLAEAITAAADALFRVKNIANARGVLPLTYEQLHRTPDPAGHDAEVAELSREWSAKS